MNLLVRTVAVKVLSVIRSWKKTGNVVGVKAVNEGNEIMLITTEGIIIRLQCSDISVLGRITSGVKLMDVAEKYHGSKHCKSEREEREEFI